jgi:hypothetical protein
MTILMALQFLACLALAVFALRWHVTHAAGESAYRHLLPFTIAASVLGLVLVYPFAMELFVAWYSGAMYEMEAVAFRFNGPYWWAYRAGFVLPLLPVFGLFPWIGKRPVVMLVIAVLALVPVAFVCLSSLRGG